MMTTTRRVSRPPHASRRVVPAVVGLVAAVTLAATASATPLVLDFEAVEPRATGLGPGFWVDNPGFVTQGTTFGGGSFLGFVVSESTITGRGGYFYPQEFDAANAAAEISAESNAGAGGGVNGSTRFAVGYNATSFVNLPAGYRPSSVYATNIATTAWLLGNSDPNNFARPLSQNDEQFSVTFRGWSLPDGSGTQLGAATLVLGSYTNNTRAIVTEWTLIDLTELGAAASIDLIFASYDVGDFGINTPTYVALDNLALVAVPEPGTWALLVGAAAVATAAARLRRRVR